jgi:ArsR family transcriptional regulator
MENARQGLKAISDETRMQIIRLLLQQNCCAGAVARHLGITEAAVSQHIKVLRDAGLLDAKKCGYFVHHTVNREALGLLAQEIAALALIQTGGCRSNGDDCVQKARQHCRGHRHGLCESEEHPKTKCTGESTANPMMMKEHTHEQIR